MEKNKLNSVRERFLSPFQKNKKQGFREFMYLCKVSQLLNSRGGFLTQVSIAPACLQFY